MLDGAIQGYIDCAFWSEEDTQDAAGRWDKLSEHEIAPETIKTLESDVLTFWVEHEDVIMSLVFTEGEPRGEEHVGHDLWLTRNGHGCGFWESGRWVNTEAAASLDTAAKRLGERALYLGDDGLVYAY